MYVPDNKNLDIISFKVIMIFIIVVIIIGGKLSLMLPVPVKALVISSRPSLN